jgi:branched-chain amino acid aminotransferase
MQVWLNGHFVDRNAARISVFDAGLQHGVGLFETMLARKGRVFRIQNHLQRMAISARELHLVDRLRIGPLADAVQSVLERNQMTDARVRLTLTGGDLNSLQTGQGPPPIDPTILIVTQPPTEYPQAFFKNGVTVAIADGRANPFDPHAGHKTLNYWPRIAALQAAAASAAGESLWFTVSNHLAGGSVSNIFLVEDGALSTPIARGEEEAGSLPSPVLPGITRAAVIDQAGKMRVGVRRRMLDINDLLEADEVFLTNSSWGVLPVVKVEKEAIGSGLVGELTRRLRDDWLAMIEEETG